MPPRTPPREVTGRHHPLIKRIRAMVRSGELRDEGEILLETPNLIEDALRSGVAISTLLLRSDAKPSVRGLLQRVPGEVKQYIVETKRFAELSSTESNPGIIALARAPAWKEQEMFPGSKPLLLVLAGIQDPGNLGAILRAAEAFGVTGVLTTRGTVSPFNAKAIRAASGTIFRLPVFTELSPRAINDLLRRRNVVLFASTPRGGESVAEIDVSRPLALALGSEGTGLPRELEAAGRRVSIPIAMSVESLNVASAASVMLYEIARQRQRVAPTAGAKEID
jgi:RNA methyltransferase, TrmH family